MKWYISGTFNNNLDKFKDIKNSNILILGDACFFNKSKEKVLKKANKTNNNFYCIRGGLENNPEFIEGLVAIYDDRVKGLTFYNVNYPNIRYFEDGQIYDIGGQQTLVIGGGLPINERELLLKGKEYYPDNVLKNEELHKIEGDIDGKEVDLVLTYTAPHSWEESPNEDLSMELWFSRIKNLFTWKKWMFGKYKKDINLDEDIMEIYDDIFEIRKDD